MKRPRLGPHTAEHCCLFLLGCLGVFSWCLDPSTYIADDSFFYPVIARNIVMHGEQTFSGVYPTNGAHPLWLYLLTVYSYVCSWLTPTLLWNVHFAVPLAAACVLWGAWNLARAANRLQLSLACMAGIPLVYVILLSVLYSEGHLLFGVLSWLIWVTVENLEDLPRKGFQLGLIVGLLFLARLDSMFLAATYGIWYTWQVKRTKPMILFGSGAALLAVPYVISNLVFFGAAMPISGWMKSSFPSIVLRGLQGHTASYTFLGYNILLGIVPILFAPIVLTLARGGPTKKITEVGWVLWWGTLLQFVYVAMFTRSHTGWYWYYVQPVMLFGLTSAVAWRDVQGRFFTSRRMPHRTQVSGIAAMLVLLVAYCIPLVGSRWHTATPFASSPHVKNLMRYLTESKLHGKTILISDFPGIPAFFTDNSFVATDLLTANRLLYNEITTSPNALKALFDHCRQRGSPIQYVIYSGSKWLLPDTECQSVIFNDPRQYPVLKPIGSMTFEQPAIEVVSSTGGPLFVVWRVVEESAQQSTKASPIGAG